MNPRPEALPTRTRVNRRPAADRPSTLDDRWDLQMSRLLRDAANAREQRDRTRAGEDDRTSRREAAALLQLVQAHDRPKVDPTSHTQPRAEHRDRRS